MIGDNIKKARKDKGMTQEELAIRLNVVRQTVSKWEKNLSVPDADLLEKLSDILSVDVNVLLGCELLKHEITPEELAKINEQEVAKTRAGKKVWTVVGIILVSFLVVFFWYVLGKTVQINENTVSIPKRVIFFNMSDFSM